MTLSAPNAPLETLRSVFGYDSFLGSQESVVRQVLDGGDAVVLMPTGSGKSLCYQLPALLRPGVGVIVSPLIALMQDQVQGLRAMGVRAAALNSSLHPLEAREVEDAALAGQLDLLYVAPERLVRPAFLQFLQNCRLALFAIDEAHCVSQWGHDFRPEYLQLNVIGEQFPGVPRLALTATADVPTQKDIVEKLGFQRAAIFATGYDRPELHYAMQPKSNPHRQLLRFIRDRHRGESGIVYRLSRKMVEKTADWLRQQGVNALPYHAGLPPEVRRHNQERFIREEGLVIVATIAFGMGVDKPNVRFVAHLEPPKSLEAYHQETGRAGRDGLPADAWLLYGMQDVVLLRNILMEGEAPEERKRVELLKFNALLGLLETAGCRRQALLGYFGENLEEPCGNCDNCFAPPETFDATVAAQKALSNVFRTGQRFGASHLTEVLLGHETARIASLEHDQLSTYGIGTEHDREQWLSIHRQLVAGGLLDLDLAGFGGLLLNEKSWQVLRGERTVLLRRERKEPAPTRGTRRTASAAAAAIREQALQTPQDEALFERLREERMTVSVEDSVPPYAVFADRTLFELVAYRPTSLNTLQNIHGIGQAKLQRYGERFLEIIRSHEAEHGRPENLPEQQEKRIRPAAPAGKQELGATARKSVAMLDQCGDVAEVARQRGLNEATIWKHMAEAISQGELPLDAVVDLDDATLQEVHEALRRNGAQRLRQVFEQLEERVPYTTLHCVRAAWLCDSEEC